MPTVSSVVNHFPTAREGFTTTLASTIASGATTISLNSVTGYSNGEIVVLVVDPSDVTKKQAFTGVVDTAGVQITGVVWTEGTNQTHTAGSTVVDYVTATHMAMVTKGLKVSHDQDGTLKAGAVDVAGVLASGVVTEPKMADNSVDSRAYVDGSIDPEHLTTGTGTTWAWQSWTPTGSNLTVGNGTWNEAKFIQVGKLVRFKVKFTAGTTSDITAQWGFSLPVTAATVVSDSIGMGYIDDAAGSSFPFEVQLANTTTTKTVIWQRPGTYISRAGTGSTVPFDFTTGDFFDAHGTYEAA